MPGHTDRRTLVLGVLLDRLASGGLAAVAFKLPPLVFAAASVVGGALLSRLRIRSKRPSGE
ncbi:MAG TPA: hypothetical protein VKA36_09495 [Solirubrobacterales bacterium]|nr:hypothetical protein [Solirubrobacterales bacterium]